MPAEAPAVPKHSPHTRAGDRSNNAAPLLEPEGLALTNTAFTNHETPQAQNIVTGQGVTVAYLAGPIDTNNPEFIRPDGTHVFTSFKDFSGDGPHASGDALESYIDAGSIAAQGRRVYDVANFVSTAHRHSGLPSFRIKGVVPGASLMGFDIFPSIQGGAYYTDVLQAIQYAVDHGANILSESIGTNSAVTVGLDPIIMAGEAAVHAGLTVVVSSRDTGSRAGVEAPANAPGAIAAGASTQLQFERQTSADGAQLGSGYLSDNVTSGSNGGMTLTGTKTVDVLAPGGYGWAPCTASPTYTTCLNDNAGSSSLTVARGTSESAPLIAGEAALIIEAYRKSHTGSTPSPAIVKQIIMSTATDLGTPTYEQGAGLINSLKAVKAAESYAKTSDLQGNALMASPNVLHATVAPGARKQVLTSNLQ